MYSSDYMLPVDFYNSKGLFKTEFVYEFMCTPKNLRHLAFVHDALFCICPSKYGCRQFVSQAI